MKLIYPDKILGITADTAETEFPAAYALTNILKQVWRSAGNTGVLTLNVSGPASAVAMFGCNADSVTVRVASGIDAEWASPNEWDADHEWYQGATVTTATYDLTATGIGSLWAAYAAHVSGHSITLTMTAPVGTAIEVGRVVAGTVNDFRDPRAGSPKEGLHDYSIAKELNGGHLYIKDLDIVRTYQWQLFADQDTAFYTFMHNFAMLNGKHPVAWQISENKTNWEWIVFARLARMPSGDHGGGDLSSISISIREVV